MPFASRLLNTRTMKDTFRSFVELLISIALDEDMMTALERSNGEFPPTDGPLTTSQCGEVNGNI